MALFETRNAKRSHKRDQQIAGIRHLNWSQVQHGLRNADSLRNNNNSRGPHTYFNIKNTVPEYLTLRNKDELYESISIVNPSSLVSDIIDAIERPRSAYMQIKLMRGLLYRAGTEILLLDEIVDKLIVENSRVTKKVGERGGRRWTPEDDEMLIEMASHDDATIIDLSKEFGRTPGAIQSRISKLVGIKKISAEVAGRFIGTFNGEFVEGEINGTVSKS